MTAAEIRKTIADLERAQKKSDLQLLEKGKILYTIKYLRKLLEAK